MSIFHAIVLGITQGLAEYLPISSSGHLILIPWLFGWKDFAGDESLKKTFDVALHLGTLGGAVTYFRSDIRRLVRAAILDPKRKDGRLAWLIALSAVPAAITGALLSSTIEDETDQIWVIAVMLIVGALALAWADGALGKRTIDEVTTKDAVIVGLAQAAALQPGVSRSGVTMTAGRFVGLGRDAAARFAFLMSLPVTAGALLFKFVDVQSDGGVPDDMRNAFIVGIVTSAITGYIAVWGTLKLVRSHSFAPFVLYRIVLGVFILLVLATPWR
ncbi:MAG TPA: undecaprenyl-diphosphate phosphatase [Acidimicrobiales bacterium]|jgi:undecaprenyl-diphosphatase|nr:undecaprenyl-diphosphate phosphatase [Acidimicrobiales bacterium]